MEPSRARDLFYKYAAAVAYVAVETPAGDEAIGTAFHIGDNIWITARHVIEGNKVLEIATTRKSIASYTDTVQKTGGVLDGGMFSLAGSYRLVGEPMLHPERGVDVAALRLEGPFTPQWLSHPAELWGDRSQPIPVVQLGGWLDDWLGDELMLEPVVVMGYPPIPFGRQPLLVATRAEINTVLDKRDERHPYFILSAMARGGFSGALAITEFENALGVATESLVMDSKPAESGFFAVLTVEPIYTCLDYYGVTLPQQEFMSAMDAELEEYRAWEAKRDHEDDRTPKEDRADTPTAD